MLNKNVEVSGIVTFKDIITIVSLVISLTLAWGVFSTRLSLAEKSLVDNTKITDTLVSDVRKLEQRVQTAEKDIATIQVKIQTR